MREEASQKAEELISKAIGNHLEHAMHDHGGTADGGGRDAMHDGHDHDEHEERGGDDMHREHRPAGADEMHDHDEHAGHGGADALTAPTHEHGAAL